MLKRFFMTLAFCVSCALLSVACGGSYDANSNNSAPANGNAGKAATNNATNNASSSIAHSNTPATTTGSGEKIGVPECDDYLAKYESCVSSKVPEAARAQYESSLAQTRKSWRDLAANPQTKASLAQACKTATESARQTMKAMGCEF